MTFKKTDTLKACTAAFSASAPATVFTTRIKSDCAALRQSGLDRELTRRNSALPHSASDTGF